MESKQMSPHPGKHLCSVNGQYYTKISTSTVLHQIKHPWELSNIDQDYFYCSDPQCKVVYFGEDDTLIMKDRMRTTSDQSSELVCFCFGVNRLQAKEAEIKNFVAAQTKEQSCACKFRNPSGRCCLGDFPL